MIDEVFVYQKYTTDNVFNKADELLRRAEVLSRNDKTDYIVSSYINKTSKVSSVENSFMTTSKSLSMNSI